MVNRCVYGFEGESIVQYVVNISWELGFTKEAKREYVKRIISQLPVKAVDVTTASPDPKYRALSPYYIVANGVILEDFFHTIDTGDNKWVYPFIYFNWLSDYLKESIESADYFLDVFHNPDNKGNVTQAYWCSLYKALVHMNKKEMLEDADKFAEWYNSITPVKIYL